MRVICHVLFSVRTHVSGPGGRLLRAVVSDNDCPLWISQAADQIKRLYDLFLKVDATQVEVNPLGETPEGQGTVAFCSFDNSIVENKCLLACVCLRLCVCVFRMGMLTCSSLKQGPLIMPPRI